MSQKELHDYLVSRHGLIRFSLHDLLKAVDEAHIDISVKDMLALEKEMVTPNSSVVMTPEVILSFVKTVIKQTKCNSVYVPFSKGIEIEEFKGDIDRLDYHILDKEYKAFVEKQTGIQSKDDLDVDGILYEIIYSDLPFAWSYKKGITTSIVEKSIGKLAENGRAIFVFTNGITVGEYSRRWLEKLEKQGSYVEAIIDIPEGAYAPITMTGVRILIFTKTRNERVFLAQAKKTEDIPFIVNYYLSRQDSPKSKALGIWVRRGEYSDYSTYDNEQRRIRTTAKMAKDYNGEIKAIGSISHAIITPKKTGAEFVDAENAVYIPKLGRTDIVLNLEDLQIKPQNYIQVLVNQDIILPRFLAFVLNSDKGNELRVRASSGVIPSLSVERIKTIEIPLPSICIQEKILETYDELIQIDLEVSKLKNRLITIPASYKNVARDIKDVNNRGDKFEQWIESLPYPLATILKRYTACDSSQQKQEMLLYFFEAYSIFAAAIMSAVYKNPIYEQTALKDVDLEYFEKASFGSWVRIDRAMAKVFRDALNQPDKIDSVLNSFHTDDVKLVKQISDGGIFTMLNKACNWRNSWKGHSGISSEEIYAEHTRQLEGIVFRFQEKTQGLYERIRLIRPVGLRKSHGEFINRVEVLSGSNSIFKKAEVIGEALDEENLYIQVLDSGATIELPPFLVMKNSPADVKNACYFYSRLEGSKSRYVSYHYEGQPEDIEDGERAFDAIKGLLMR